MNKDEPRKLWLQVYDEEGNYMDPEWRTFSADERVNPTDLCYVRWGKTNILCIERDAALARAEEAEARVAELEAQLAAQQWRPVTEDWPHYHDRVVIAHWGGTWAQFARRVQSDDGEDEWLLDDGRKFDFESASVALLTSPPPLPH